MSDTADINIAVARALWGFDTPDWSADTWPWWATDEDGASYPRLPSFSTNIPAAFEILDKMMQTVFAVELRANHESGWVCEFEFSDGDKVNSLGATAPLAICNAALCAARTASGEPAE